MLNLTFTHINPYGDEIHYKAEHPQGFTIKYCIKRLADKWGFYRCFDSFNVSYPISFADIGAIEVPKSDARIVQEFFYKNN